MTHVDPGRIRSANLVLPCRDLSAALDYVTTQLGFRLEAIYPADHPTRALVSGHGTRFWLDATDGADSWRLRVATYDPVPSSVPASPDATRIEWVGAVPRDGLPPPEPSFAVHRAADSPWGTGRAGMQYRDIVPDRMDGHYIASHIRIPTGGPVPDYVHHHHVRFQLIYCWRGWVQVVYEDQGPPFTMRPGDCVLQPPHIRHRVLACSDGLEVVEFTGPAEHLTEVDHDLDLPTAHAWPDRDFCGQRFVRHRAADATWSKRAVDGFESRSTGIGQATSGLAAVEVVRPGGLAQSPVRQHRGAFVFGFVLGGKADLTRPQASRATLAPGDGFVVPGDQPFALAGCTEDFEFLEIALPEPGVPVDPDDRPGE